ncbi:GTP-binding protein [Helicobacter didelphidarum]|uniref:GTP-binding protein n=2 Tax=Helicobacter didelphidarum TaxID=2040648 RepID=A0A3D8IRI7_9HELI|nr:GTP-binding protein [Helicobacter didelphidarum]
MLHDSTWHKLLDNSIFEIFLQECLKVKMQDYDTDNPISTLIAHVRYALTQSTPLTPEQKTDLKELQEDVYKPMKVAVIGQFSSGKSTFLNALLGQEILPSGITPVTAKVCEIVYGEEISLEVLYKNGKIVAKPIGFLNDADEMENAKITSYKLFAPLQLLKEVVFLDTPGFNSQNQSDTDTTNAILEHVDGIIWLTLIDNVGKNSEKEILQTYIKRYASKSLCVLNQKDRLKSQNEINTSLDYAKKAFNGFFEDTIAISARNALNAINTMYANNPAPHVLSCIKLKHGVKQKAQETENMEKFQDINNTESIQDNLEHQQEDVVENAHNLYRDSNIQAVLDFISTSIQPQAENAKKYRILRTLRTLIVREKRKIHKLNVAYKELDKILHIYSEKLRFNLLQSNLEKQFNKLFGMLDNDLDNLTQIIYNSFELRPIEIVREGKNKFGFKTNNIQIREVNMLPKERLLSQLHNSDNDSIRNLKKIGFLFHEFGENFTHFVVNQGEELSNDLESWCEETLQSLRFSDSIENAIGSETREKYLQSEVLENEIIYEFLATQDRCMQSLRCELAYLQQSLSDNFENMVLLCLERLNFEVQNALSKHRKDPDTLPLYNPTLENVRDLINLGLHFNVYQEKLSLNFPLYKKTLWNLMQELTKTYNIVHTKIGLCIDNNQKKYDILQECNEKIKTFKI